MIFKLLFIFFLNLLLNNIIYANEITFEYKKKIYDSYPNFNKMKDICDKYDQENIQINEFNQIEVKSKEQIKNYCNVARDITLNKVVNKYKKKLLNTSFVNIIKLNETHKICNKYKTENISNNKKFNTVDDLDQSIKAYCYVSSVKKKSRDSFVYLQLKKFKGGYYEMDKWQRYLDIDEMVKRQRYFNIDEIHKETQKYQEIKKYKDKLNYQTFLHVDKYNFKKKFPKISKYNLIKNLDLEKLHFSFLSSQNYSLSINMKDTLKSVRTCNLNLEKDKLIKYSEIIKRCALPSIIHEEKWCRSDKCRLLKVVHLLNSELDNIWIDKIDHFYADINKDNYMDLIIKFKIDANISRLPSTAVAVITDRRISNLSSTHYTAIISSKIINEYINLPIRIIY